MRGLHVRRGGWRGALLALATAILAACAAPAAAPPAAPAPAPAPSPASAATAPAPSPQQLNVAFTSISFAQLALPVAQEMGLFDQHGLAVELILGPNGMPALLAGEVQTVVGSTEDALLANLGGADVVIVAALVPYLQHKFMVRPEIQTMADLRDRPVGVSKRGTLTHTVVRMAAQRGGLDPERDLTIVELGTADKQIAALAAGSIYGSSASPPNTDVAERAGAHALYDFAAERIEYPAASVIVSRAWAAQHEATLLAFLRALAAAEHVVHTRPDEAAAVYARWAKTGDEAAAIAVALAREAVPIRMLPTAPGIGLVLETVAAQNAAAAGAEPTRFFDDRHIQQLEREGFYARLGAN
ncbi:MAG TPA: ABC transporter substrate-binding protein [Chloroflexota bacterium]|nr:ABC transporter substrate-binding protein [Chloroflexota bacterium]